jgi:hypothetical protein
MVQHQLEKQDFYNDRAKNKDHYQRNYSFMHGAFGFFHNGQVSASEILG